MGSKEYHAEYNLRRYNKKREEYIQYMGGECVACGSKNDLHFDHKDPATKEFTIGSRLTYSRETVLKELEKCQLLCGECHNKKTQQQKDGYNKRARGSRVNHAVLKESDIPKVRELCKTMTQLDVSKVFGVSRKAVSHIITGRTWRHV